MRRSSLLHTAGHVLNLKSPSHGENRGSSPLGSANDFNDLAIFSACQFVISPTFLQWAVLQKDHFEQPKLGPCKHSSGLRYIAPPAIRRCRVASTICDHGKRFQCALSSMAFVSMTCVIRMRASVLALALDWRRLERCS